jgi:hypothetical protein
MQEAFLIARVAGLTGRVQAFLVGPVSVQVIPGSRARQSVSRRGWPYSAAMIGAQMNFVRKSAGYFENRIYGTETTS